LIIHSYFLYDVIGSCDTDGIIIIGFAISNNPLIDIKSIRKPISIDFT